MGNKDMKTRMWGLGESKPECPFKIEVDLFENPIDATTHILRATITYPPQQEKPGPAHTIYLLDTSYSMTSMLETNKIGSDSTRLAVAKKNLLHSIQEDFTQAKTRVSVVAFSNQTETIVKHAATLTPENQKKIT